jgi:hypothetical protein
MKRTITITGIIISILLLLTVFSSCTQDKIKASLGEEFTLPLGKTAVIGGENLTFEFVEVTADSRCAKGVECIWAGEAKCRMLITYKGTESEIVFTQPGEVVNSFGSLNNYSVMYKLEPYPEEGKQIADSEYQLKMTVTK